MKGAGVALVTLSVVGSLVAVWWWAIAGMSQEVGGASGFTVFLLMMVGSFLATGET